MHRTKTAAVRNDAPAQWERAVDRTERTCLMILSLVHFGFNRASTQPAAVIETRQRAKERKCNATMRYDEQHRQRTQAERRTKQRSAPPAVCAEDQNAVARLVMSHECLCHCVVHIRHNSGACSTHNPRTMSCSNTARATNLWLVVA